MRSMLRTALAFLALSLCLASGAQAQRCTVPLVGFGPIDPADGFPQYYLDSNNLPLAQCLDVVCDPAFTVPDPSQPVVFPTNFPTDFFYHRAQASMTGPNGETFLLDVALLGSFINGTPVNGDQMVFSRLRFRGTGHLVVAENRAHVTTTEVMSAAALSGIAFKSITGDGRGQISADQVRLALEPDEPYDVEVVDLVSVENTHGHAGGTVMSVEDLRAIRKVAQEAGLPVHMDGARIFNAAVASGTDVAEFCAEVDTMMFCVSKGLGAPIGSLVCGPADMVREARRLKILFGGAWRQAGVVAAAGLVALEEGPTRLHEDHVRARRLAEGVAEALPGSIDPSAVETNMVYADTEAVGMEPLEAIARLKEQGVGATFVSGKVRMVTHVDITDQDIETAIAAWRAVAAAAREEER